ncbi:Ionotropic glutamate receptor [Cynara cardunculus var. scolymus]|uniref:Ionotropic glutamate receptor n=1 Tax=Cynara cardunculus var. scolymus TaxID=59895 RepID=A0A103YIG0_CYNCS|nr:Ionotropic glutamate receptor [Cynara cardunculus var. scolymus]
MFVLKEERKAFVIQEKHKCSAKCLNEVMCLLQGAVGSKSYFPASRELHVELNWRKEYYSLNPFKEFKELDPNGIWAYDAVCALAMGVERAAGNLSRFVATVSVFVVLVLTSSYIVTLTSLFTVQQIASKEECIGFQDFPPIAEGAVFNSLEFAEVRNCEIKFTS